MFFACSKNPAECDEAAEEDASSQCVQKSEDEKASIHLNNKEYQKAIDILQALIDQDNEDVGTIPKCERYLRIANAYASLGNCVFFDLVQKFGGEDFDPATADCETTAFSGESSFNKIVLLNEAVKNLGAIPACEEKVAQRCVDQSTHVICQQDEPFYRQSLAIQNLIFKPILTVKCIKLFDYVYDNPGEKSLISSENLSKSSCSPSGIQRRLQESIANLIQESGFNCTEKLEAEQCGSMEEKMAEYGSQLEEELGDGNISEQLSNLMSARCKSENPEAECPEIDLN